jgi:WXG100 family type VII secretion target
MGAPTVRSDYEQLKGVASQFRAQADAINQTNQQLKSCTETLKGGDWIGEGARKYFAEMDGQVMPTMQRLQRALNEAGRITAQIAQIMKQAEDDASGCFRVA